MAFEMSVKNLGKKTFATIKDTQICAINIIFPIEHFKLFFFSRILFSPHTAFIHIVYFCHALEKEEI
jgi:hypothetical protein